MNASHPPVTFVWPGDLHLEFPDRDNHRTAQWMVEEVNTLIRPDFVQFAGDNVQHARDEEFELLRGLLDRLQVDYHLLVGDHDAHHDPAAQAFRGRLGETHGAFSLRGFRFIRLNSMEYRPLGFSPEQIFWFQYQVDAALGRGEQVVVFQHHYPYQIWEDFDGPGVDAWRGIVQTRRIAAIFAGHTHYDQVANDGRNIVVATRSIGEPEGGPPGYALVHLEGDDLAMTYRAIEDEGPVALITHPRDAILCQSGRHVVTGPTEFAVRGWSRTPVVQARGKIGDAEWFALDPAGDNQWRGPIPGDRLSKGEHDLSVELTDSEGQAGRHAIRFAVDRSGRYTAWPRVRPEVHQTRFC